MVVRRRNKLLGSLPMDLLQVVQVALVTVVKGRCLQMLASISPPIDLEGYVKILVRLEAQMFAPIVWVCVVDPSGI